MTDGCGQGVRDILDDEIYGWIVRLNRNAVRTVFIFDSCLSGGVARPAGTELKRLAPALSNASTSRADGGRNLRGEISLSAATPAVVVTASASRENAYGQMDETGIYRGVFTSALHRLLLPADATVPPSTWLGVIGELGRRLELGTTGAPKQTPHVFGARSAPVFDSGKPFSHAIEARRRSSRTAELAAGAAGGITPGSVFKLFGPQQIPWRSAPQFEAKAKVARVLELTAELEVSEGELASERLHAVELEYALPEARPKVALAPAARLSSSDRPALRGALVGIGELVDAGAHPELLVSTAGDKLQIVTPAGAQVGAPVELEGTALRESLRARLGEYVRWKRLLAWKRTSVRPAGLKVTVEYRSGLDVRTLQIDARDQARIPAAATVKLRVQNIGVQRARVDALLLRQDFTVDVCPLGIVERNAPAATEEASLGSGVGLAAFKLIVSDPQQAVDFSYLHSRTVTRAPRSSLEAELAAIWRSGADAPAPRSLGGKPFQWQTLELPFTVTAADAGQPHDAAPKRCSGIPQ